MTDRLAQFIAAHKESLEAALELWLPLSERAGAEPLNRALRYAVFPGGKRLRPMLTLMATKLVAGDLSKALPAACAIEFLHTSSLILDDLPAMDDADLRRGRPATHLIFGESVALLAALALFNQSYALLARAASDGQTATKLIAEAARCIGANGMIGGQAVDLAPRAVKIGAEASASRNLKTTALMRLTMIAGAIASGADEADLSALSRFGECLGAAYQVCDDLLDELSASELTGKTARQDARHLRPTSVAELGVEGARRLAMSLAEESKAVISERFGLRHEASLLIDVVNLVMRDEGAETAPEEWQRESEHSSGAIPSPCLLVDS
jgi:geranylgeranyl diphosphate synthase type II